MCNYVVVIGMWVHLGLKYKLCKYLLTKIWKISFCFSHWKACIQAGSQWPPPPWNFDGTPWPRWVWYLFAKMTAKGWTYNIIEAFGKIFCRFSATMGKLGGGVTVIPPPLLKWGLMCILIIYKHKNYNRGAPIHFFPTSCYFWLNHATW